MTPLENIIASAGIYLLAQIIAPTAHQAEPWHPQSAVATVSQPANPGGEHGKK